MKNPGYLMVSSQMCTWTISRFEQRSIVLGVRTWRGHAGVADECVDRPKLLLCTCNHSIHLCSMPYWGADVPTAAMPTSDATVTSAGLPNTRVRPPSPSTVAASSCSVATAASSLVLLRLHTLTRAPRRTSSNAVSRPMPSKGAGCGPQLCVASSPTHRYHLSRAHACP